jgi:hypothetical protein
MCRFHVILLSKITPRYFTGLTKGDIPFIHCKMSLRGPESIRKVDGLRLIFIDFYVPAFTPRH